MFQIYAIWTQDPRKRLFEEKKFYYVLHCELIKIR